MQGKARLRGVHCRLRIYTWCPQSDYDPFNAAAGPPDYPLFWEDSNPRCVTGRVPTCLRVRYCLPSPVAHVHFLAVRVRPLVVALCPAPLFGELA